MACLKYKNYGYSHQYLSLSIHHLSLIAQQGVSVIVCCYNSASLLPETLTHLALQVVSPDISWEIIIVNNNSADDTENKAKEVWSKLACSVSFNIVSESRQGLSNARTKGAATAMYEYMLFCDDDNWLYENYVQTAYEIMTANKNIGILAGQSQGYFEIAKPSWFENFKTAYAVGKPVPKTGSANERKYIAGAGMIIRKSIFQLLKKFSFQQIVTDRKGNDLISGGDAELCLLAMFLGYDLYYDEKLQFTHYITKKRVEWPYCVSMCVAHAKPQVYFHLYEYCFENMIQENKIDFNLAYKIYWQKHLKSLLRNGKNIRTLFKTLKSIFHSQPGSIIEIETKKKICKIVYALKNKKQIEADFSSIKNVLQKIIEFKEGGEANLPLIKESSR